MQEHIDTDLADGTMIPGWYEEIQSLLDKAKKTLKKGDINTTLDIIGEINLDALQAVDELDDMIGEVIQQLKRIQKRYLSEGVSLPTEIHTELNNLKNVLNKYDDKNVSQTSP